MWRAGHAKCILRVTGFWLCWKRGQYYTIYHILYIIYYTLYIIYSACHDTIEGFQVAHGWLLLEIRLPGGEGEAPPVLWRGNAGGPQLLCQPFRCFVSFIDFFGTYDGNTPRPRPQPTPSPKKSRPDGRSPLGLGLGQALQSLPSSARPLAWHFYASVLVCGRCREECVVVQSFRDSV